MHLVEFTHDGWTRLGVLRGDHVVDVTMLGYPTTLQGWFTATDDVFARLTMALTTATIPTRSLADVHLNAPLRAPSKIIAIGINYLDHCREQGIEPPNEPLVFSKFPSTLIGPFDTISWEPTLTCQVDPEVELGVIIGRRCHMVSVEQAIDYVFGYTVVNDVSARDLQFGDGQWTRGKNLDTFCPIGPAIVTRDEVPDPQSLGLRLWINDRLQQDGTTAEMLFSVAQIIAHVSRFATLEPGDLILTGTPKGVGCFRIPPIYLTSGDMVRCAIDGLGEMKNPTQVTTAIKRHDAMTDQTRASPRRTVM